MNEPQNNSINISDENSIAFFKNWQKILYYNQICSQKKTPPQDKIEDLEHNFVEIPFFPINIELSNFTKLWSKLYLLFMNSNANALEILLDLNHNIDRIFLHKANQDGQYIDFFEIKKQDIPIQEINKDTLEENYEKIRIWAKEKYSVDVGNIRAISSKVFKEMLTKYQLSCESTKKNKRIDLLELTGFYLDFICDAQSKSEFIVYPESIFFNFVVNLRNFYGDFSYHDLSLFIKDILPDTHLTMTFHEAKICISHLIEISSHFVSTKTLSIPEMILVNNDDFEREENLLKYLAKSQKSKYNYLCKVEPYIDVIYDILQSPIPTEAERISFLFQKLLFRYRSLDQYWNIYPKPLHDHSLMRFFLYSAGFYLNLRKLSYWSIPYVTNLVLNKWVGLKCKLCVIIGSSCEREKSNKIPKQPTLIQSDEFYAGILDIENGSIIDFTPLNIKQVLPDIFPEQYEKFDNFTQIRLNLSKKFGYISNVVWISQNLFSQIFSNIVLDLHSSNPLPLRNIRKTIKSLQNPSEFYMCPENAVYLQFQKEKPIFFIRRVLPLLTDLIEF